MRKISLIAQDALPVDLEVSQDLVRENIEYLIDQGMADVIMIRFGHNTNNLK